MKNVFQYVRILTGLVLFMSFPFVLFDAMPLGNFLTLLGINFVLNYLSSKIYPEDKYFEWM